LSLTVHAHFTAFLSWKVYSNHPDSVVELRNGKKNRKERVRGKTEEG